MRVTNQVRIGSPQPCEVTRIAPQVPRRAAAQTSGGSFSAPLVWLTDLGYWVLPKPVDLGRLVFDALGAQTHFRPLLESTAMLPLSLSVLTSLLFTAYILFAAGKQFAQTDY